MYLNIISFFLFIEKKLGDEVIFISFCLVSFLVCLDFIKFFFSIKVFFVLWESKMIIRFVRK